MQFLRVADEARDRRKAAKVPAAAGSGSIGVANMVDDRVGTITGLLNEMATGQAFAADGYASASSADSRPSSRSRRRSPPPSLSRSPSPCRSPSPSRSPTPPRHSYSSAARGNRGDRDHGRDRRRDRDRGRDRDRDRVRSRHRAGRGRPRGNGRRNGGGRDRNNRRDSSRSPSPSPNNCKSCGAATRYARTYCLIKGKEDRLTCPFDRKWDGFRPDWLCGRVGVRFRPKSDFPKYLGGTKEE